MDNHKDIMYGELKDQLLTSFILQRKAQRMQEFVSLAQLMIEQGTLNHNTQLDCALAWLQRSELSPYECLMKGI